MIEVKTAVQLLIGAMIALSLSAQTADLNLALEKCRGSLAGDPRCKTLEEGLGDRTALDRPAPLNDVTDPKSQRLQPELELRDRALAPNGATKPSQEPPPVAPDPRTEFQKFVAVSLGENLSVFGSNLFEGVPATFAPVDRAPVTADYVLGPGDEVALRVWGQVNLDRTLVVDRAGFVYLPQVGAVSVAGLRFEQLAGYMRSHLERVYRNFDLHVNMGQLRSIQIFVVGHARRPGSYTVGSLSTLVNALFASGGPSPGGSMRRIQVKRGTAVVTEFDLYDLLLDGDKSKDAHLLPGDVVYIPPVGEQVAVGGSVKNSGIYELKGGTPVSEVLRLAGGLSPTADRGKLTLERISNGRTRQVIEVALGEAASTMTVSDGDVLRVRPIVPKFENAVTLRGNVANPGRFAWRAGMRLRDIIPDKESLLTRNYWNRRNLLGFPAPDRKEGSQDRSPGQLRKTEIDLTVPAINWSYAVIERQHEVNLSLELVPFHPGRLILEGDDTQNLELRPGDVVTVFSDDDVRVPVSKQQRVVRVEGEFNAPGIYAIKPGETLGDLIRRAGGLTGDAYTPGSEFYRESARREQQRRLDEYTRQMERDIDRAASSKMSSAVTAEDAANVTARMEAEKRLLEGLRNLKASGRVVLHLEPGSQPFDGLLDLPLEAADVVYVPAKPSTVYVLGSVYNQNSFLYEPALRVADYLRQAGGASRTADTARMFIIRADGSVLPKQDPRFGMFKADFEETRLHPGDSIVVPEHMFKGSLIRGLRDWSQIIAQFGLGAAAINVLR